MALKLRRGLSENLEGQIFAEGELIYTTDTKLIYVGDGATPGEDLTPLGTGGGSSPGINDTANTPVLTLTDSSAALAVNTTINGDLIIGDYEITGTFDISTEGRITVTGDAPFGQITAREFSDGTAQLVGGVFTGNVVGDVTGNVTGDLDGNVTTNNIITEGNLDVRSDELSTSVTMIIESDEEQSKTTYRRISASDISGDRLNYGQINFERQDTGGNATTAYIIGGQDQLLFGADPSGTFTAQYNMYWRNGKLGVGKIPTTVLDVAGNANIVGDITANAFKGTFVADDSSIVIDGLTGEVNLANSSIGEFSVSNPQTGQVLKWNGTQWTNAADSGGGSGSGGLSSISIGADDSSLRIVESGESFLILGGTGISTTSDVEGNITISADAVSGLSSRASVAGTTASIADGADDDLDITGYKGYMLYKIQTDGAAWVRIYVNAAKRTADAARTEGQDPGPDAGVIAEVITTGAETVIVAPGVIGFNDESPVTNVIPCAVRNKTGSTGTVTVTLTAVEMEV